MVTSSMSSSVGCPKNHRASSPSSANLPRILFHTEPLASPFISISYRHPLTQESHLSPLFSITSGHILGPQGWVGVSPSIEHPCHLLTQLLPATYTHPSLRTRFCVSNAL